MIKGASKEDRENGGRPVHFFKGSLSNLAIRAGGAGHREEESSRYGIPIASIRGEKRGNTYFVNTMKSIARALGSPGPGFAN